ADGPSAPCGRLPIPLDVCPTCHGGIHPTRGCAEFLAVAVARTFESGFKLPSRARAPGCPGGVSFADAGRASAADGEVISYLAGMLSPLSALSTRRAAVVVTLLHARELRDFLGRERKDLKGFEKTDIVAGDFFDSPGEWVPHQIPSLSPAPERERLNRSLAHLPYDRVGYETTGKEWPFKEIFDEVTAAWDQPPPALPRPPPTSSFS